MRETRWTVSLAIAACLWSAAAAAQSYGPGDQTLTVGAAEFVPAQDGCVYSLSGYLLGQCPFMAPLRLPDGAHISQLCLYAFIPDGVSDEFAHIVVSKLPAGGQAPGAISIGDTDDNIPIGYGVVCSSLDYVVHEFGDIDGGGAENLSHAVLAISSGSAGLGAVKITWHREISPSPATATFNDVPVGSLYFQFIEAVKAAGITGGCQASPPLYCPDRPITRAEMAVFLSIALGLHSVE